MRCEGNAVAHCEGAAVRTARQHKFLSFSKRANQKDEILEADTRICHKVPVNLEGLTQKLTA